MHQSALLTRLFSSDFTLLGFLRRDFSSAPSPDKGSRVLARKLARMNSLSRPKAKIYMETPIKASRVGVYVFFIGTYIRTNFLKKWAIPGLFFFISSFQYTVDSKQMFNI